MAEFPERVIQSPVIDLITSFGASADLAYGQASANRVRQPMNPVLDLLLRRNPFESAAESRRWLRSYEWITVLNRQLYDRLGRSAGLDRSDAFESITPLAAGGGMFQATEDVDEYGPLESRAVFEAFKPILPPGLPRANPTIDSELHTLEDAHSQ